MIWKIAFPNSQLGVDIFIKYAKKESDSAIRDISIEVNLSYLTKQPCF